MSSVHLPAKRRQPTYADDLALAREAPRRARRSVAQVRAAVMQVPRELVRERQEVIFKGVGARYRRERAGVEGLLLAGELCNLPSMRWMKVQPCGDGVITYRKQHPRVLGRLAQRVLPLLLRHVGMGGYDELGASASTASTAPSTSEAAS